jgi:TP901-1 family phage major tail protein
MAVQSGKDLLIKVDLNGSETFQTMAGLRATRISLNAETVDVTSLESAGWRELLAGAGVKSASVTGSGVFRDQATDARAQQIFFNGEVPNFQVIVPNFGVIQGLFQISAIEYSGTYNGEATYDMTLASAGVLTFTAI